MTRTRLGITAESTVNGVTFGRMLDIFEISYEDPIGDACTLYLFRKSDDVRAIHLNRRSHVASVHTEEMEEILEQYDLIDKVSVDEIKTFLRVTE